MCVCPAERYSAEDVDGFDVVWVGIGGGESEKETVRDPYGCEGA